MKRVHYVPSENSAVPQLKKELSALKLDDEIIETHAKMRETLRTRSLRSGDTILLRETKEE